MLTANATEQVYISKPQIGTVTGKSSIYLSRRLNKPDGTFGGVVAVGLDTSYFSKFYDQIDLGKDAVFVAVNKAFTEITGFAAKMR